MNRITDVIVVGSGMAGLMAAQTAIRRNCKVRIISEGMGSLAISGGYLDLLGYGSSGEQLSDPFAGFSGLPDTHPYSILGADNIKSAIEEFLACVGAEGLKLHISKDQAGHPCNTLVPTIMGTLKPTWLVPEDMEYSTLANAKKILVVSVQGFRDCKPALIIQQLHRYQDWKERELTPLVIRQPFDENGRSLNSLDLARAAERKDGLNWLLDSLRGKGKGYDLVLLPALCGSQADQNIRARVRDALGCPFIELLAVPPAVGGLRIRDALLRYIQKHDAEMVENAQVIRGNIKDGKCISLITESCGREIEHKAHAYIIATGGILSGGIVLDAGKIRERIFGLKIDAPENVDDWTEEEIFGHHFVTSVGVSVDDKMRPINKSGAYELENVFFAGRTIGGYDYASEKSGHGVACSTGWQAGRSAASLANPMEKPSGADK